MIKLQLSNAQISTSCIYIYNCIHKILFNLTLWLKVFKRLNEHRKTKDMLYFFKEMATEKNCLQYNKF